LSSSINPDEVWPNAQVTLESGFSVEVRARVHSDVGTDGAFHVSPSSSGGAFGWLHVGIDDVNWAINAAGGPFPLATGLDNTQWHVYRLVQLPQTDPTLDPGSERYQVWRDGVLIGEDLAPGYGNTAYNFLRFGDTGGRNGGNFDFDYVRFTSGAYAPVPEPTALLMLLVGLAWLAVGRRRTA
jgi:hypothetical protein